MTRGGLALAGVVLALAGCHRRAATPLPGADGEAQARVAAKTLDDLAAADRAAARPLPRQAAPPAAHPAPARDAEDADTAEPPAQPVAQDADNAG